MLVSLSTLPIYSPPAASASQTAGSVVAAANRQLTPGQEAQVARLKQVDQDVRAHEAAHLAAGGSLVTGGPTYTYIYGPDGKQYAVGGEVGIDTSPERKPADNISKGEHIQRAALAPADPSPQDYRVAAVGEQLAANGRLEAAAEQRQAFAEAQTKAAAALGEQVSKAYGSTTAVSSTGFSAYA
ncbi:MAG TPA: putative metalloprotease CJM1_0395 family protein [Rhodocyclaceae bacterium]|nr:putative metalloprotease CJM1_0395 family protein [Rhodocyclaceae bacterium]